MQALVFANIQVVRVACSFCCVDGLHKHLWFLSLHLCNECLSHQKKKKKKKVLNAAGSGMALHGNGVPIPAKVSARSVLACAAELSSDSFASAVLTAYAW